MKNTDIMESMVSCVSERIFDEWKHEGYICGWSSNYLNVEIDGKEYMLVLHEVRDGECYSQYLPEVEG